MDNNTTNKLQSCFKGYNDMNPHLWYEHNHQIVSGKIEGMEKLNYEEYVEDENYYNIGSNDSNYDDH